MIVGLSDDSNGIIWFYWTWCQESSLRKEYAACVLEQECDHDGVSQGLALQFVNTFCWAKNCIFVLLIVNIQSLVWYFWGLLCGFLFWPPWAQGLARVPALFSSALNWPPEGKTVTQGQLLTCLSVLSSPRTGSTSEETGQAPGGCWESLM